MSTWSTRSAASMNDVEIVPRAGRTLSSDRGDVPPQRERAHDKSCVTPYRLEGHRTSATEADSPPPTRIRSGACFRVRSSYSRRARATRPETSACHRSDPRKPSLRCPSPPPSPWASSSRRAPVTFRGRGRAETIECESPLGDPHR
ncbi:MAG: hypothetical protein EOP32_30445 [Rhodococcus sp. (in: high G+C Gram-positive bacteria)]|nr:MAG: hypothetical protein EOP32_30445 [Rhodococcus sp. (in: high G+C Gram-positive bacteria)]